MAEHRVSMLSASLRRYEDPARSVDPRIRELVTQLATLDPAPPPRVHFRAELRSQLVAIAPRLVAEGPAIENPPAAQTSTTARHAAGRSARIKAHVPTGWVAGMSIARPLASITALIAVFALLLGGAVVISKEALPGDALYALKRANENVTLSLASGNADKGREYLSFAKTRADEVSALLSRSSATAGGTGSSASGDVNGHTAELIRSTLDSADSDVRNSSQLLNSDAVRSGSAAPLAIMTGWAPDQITRLQGIADRLGPGLVHDRVALSTQLTSAAMTRAQALHGVLGCHCPNTMATDDLGPVPCPACSAAQDPAQHPTASARPKHPKATKVTKRPGTPTHPQATSVGKPATRGSNPPAAPGPASESGSTQAAPAIILPTLPIQLPTLFPIPLPIPLPTIGSPASGGTHTCKTSVLGICLGP